MMNSTQEHILQTAPAVFAAHGFTGASTRVLANAAGVNIATLAYHFGNKQGLYDAVLDQVYVNIIDKLQIAAEGETPAERVRSLIFRLYAVTREQRDGIRVLLRHVMTEGNLPAQVVTKWSTKTLQKVTEVLNLLDLPQDTDHRLALLSLNHLLARYAVTDPKDLTAFVDGDPDHAVPEHLSQLAVKLLDLQ
jgi:TetR/AcrR family transcriptional regulator